jgi:hypothetical protein
MVAIEALLGHERYTGGVNRPDARWVTLLFRVS